ncbi:MAG: hypothetical protein JNL11_06885 [Bdellovibrionaceae bacterium]|nr:hypothetical protein [Pseudobdellovibrionaceae bacterium]
MVRHRKWSLLMTRFFKDLLFISIVFMGFVVSRPSAADVLACLYFYDSKAPTSLITHSYLSDLVRYRGNMFELVVPKQTMRGTVLEYRTVTRWEDVVGLYRNMGKNERLIAQSFVDRYMKDYERVSDYFKSYGSLHKVLVEARFKDIQSLRNKIIDRAKEHSEMQKVFHLELLDDFIGIRLLPSKTSELLEPLRWPEPLDQQALVEHFEKALGVSKIGSIKQVELRGGAEDQAKNRFYRAFHLTLTLGTGAPVEIQIMSKSIATWHHWDHPVVYKSQNPDGQYVASLKRYSRFWVRFIRAFEEQMHSRHFSQDIVNLFAEYGIDIGYSGHFKNKSWNWLIDLDAVVAEKNGINGVDRFLGAQSGTPLSEQMRLFVELAPGRLF